MCEGVRRPAVSHRARSRCRKRVVRTSELQTKASTRNGQVGEVLGEVAVASVDRIGRLLGLQRTAGCAWRARIPVGPESKGRQNRAAEGARNELGGKGVRVSVHSVVA